MIRVKKHIKKLVEDSDKKVKPTRSIKVSDGVYKVKPQEVLREEESDNEDVSSLFFGPSLLTQSNGQDLSQVRTEENFENNHN